MQLSSTSVQRGDRTIRSYVAASFSLVLVSHPGNVSGELKKTENPQANYKAGKLVFGVSQFLVTLALRWLPRGKTSPYPASSVTVILSLPWKELPMSSYFRTLYFHF